MFWPPFLWEIFQHWPKFLLKKLPHSFVLSGAIHFRCLPSQDSGDAPCKVTPARRCQHRSSKVQGSTLNRRWLAPMCQRPVCDWLHRMGLQVSKVKSWHQFVFPHRIVVLFLRSQKHRMFLLGVFGYPRLSSPIHKPYDGGSLLSDLPDVGCWGWCSWRWHCNLPLFPSDLWYGVEAHCQDENCFPACQVPAVQQ